jgi:hypothetical protein
VIIGLAHDLPECHEVKHSAAGAVNSLEVDRAVPSVAQNVQHARPWVLPDPSEQLGCAPPSQHSMRGPQQLDRSGHRECRHDNEADNRLPFRTTVCGSPLSQSEAATAVGLRWAVTARSSGVSPGPARCLAFLSR